MDVIASAGHPSAAPSTEPTVDQPRSRGWGTLQRSEHSNGLSIASQRGVMATNPQMVARSTQGAARRSEHDNGLTRPRDMVVTSQSANNDPSQVLDSHARTRRALVGAPDGVAGVPLIPPTGKLAIVVIGLAGLAWWLSKKRAAPAGARRGRGTSDVDMVDPDRY